jgi:signal transduction histidine kinase
VSLQPVSALVAAIVSFAIGGSVLLREPRRRAHVLFATLSFNIAAFCLISFFAKRFDSPFLAWLALLVAVSLPATAQRFFQAFLGDEAGPPPLSRSTVVGAGVLYTVLFFSRFIEPLHTTTWFAVAFLTYVFAGLYLSIFYLYKRYRSTPSRIEKTRLLYLLVGGFATVTSMVLEVVPHAPSLGSAFIIIYLYFLSQNLVRYRLLDLNELLGRMVVLGTLVFILSLIYGLLVSWVGSEEHGLFFFNSLLASATIVILIEPLRGRVENAINRWMFQEKYELSRRIEMLRADLANVIDMRVLVPRVLSALEDSRRITHASIYLADPDGSGFELAGHVGPRPEARFDAIANRPFFERLRRTSVVTLEGVEREIAAHRTTAEELESLQGMLRTLEQMNGSVALGFSGEDQVLGMLVLRDERLREAYSSDEIELFRLVATTIGVTLQNSQVYERMKERDRLAALGQMAAGLAHEIRNPLGSIKGAAQFLQPSNATSAPAHSQGDTKEFLNIIVEEVNRLNKIVSQFLDYARPYRGEQKPLEVADVLKKTLQLLVKEEETHFEITTAFAERLPPVRADAEQLLQVFLNLSLNALQAMPQGGRLLISTGLRRATRRGAAAAFLEIRFRDTGVGIPPGDLKNLFIPFFTTKDKGTGLGLPISQRIIENHGGTIEVRSQPGEGATFTVLLPVEADAYAAYAELRGEGGARRTPTAQPVVVPPGARLPPPGPGGVPVPVPAGSSGASAAAHSAPNASGAVTTGVTPPRTPAAATARKG